MVFLTTGSSHCANSSEPSGDSVGIARSCARTMTPWAGPGLWNKQPAFESLRLGTCGGLTKHHKIIMSERAASSGELFLRLPSKCQAARPGRAEERAGHKCKQSRSARFGTLETHQETTGFRGSPIVTYPNASPGLTAPFGVFGSFFSKWVKSTHDATM